MKEKILLSLTFGILLLFIAPALTAFAQSTETTSNHNPVLPFSDATVLASSSTTSTVLSFSSSTIVSSSSTTTTTGNSITFDIFETNDGIVPLTAPSVTSDNPPLCNPVFVDGDVNNNGVLDPGEQWHYTCDVVSAITGIFKIILTGFGTAPDGTVITWPGDPEERIIGTVEVVSDADSPRLLKQMAKDELSALDVTDKKDEKRISKAYKAIGKSLEDRFWQDDYTLTKHGKKVFDEEKKAVKELRKIKSVDTSGIIKMLVDADQILAQIAIDSIPTDTGDKKVDKKLAKANKEMDKAIQELEKGKPDKAIKKFKKAWENAQKAMKGLVDDDGEKAKHDSKTKHDSKDKKGNKDNKKKND